MASIPRDCGILFNLTSGVLPICSVTVARMPVLNGGVVGAGADWLILIVNGRIIGGSRTHLTEHAANSGGLSTVARLDLAENTVHAF